ncbi:3-hydroxyacyl-ACP dehydratase FabZ family protein [Thermogutta sp.]|jgi:3-hydroxyacyl-[acyl-carrier-protein] dehydratase|uniref:3-hydroxyacyl-ACP dehydratase FabZ family protein n=1 Tax=Thermogutta sp. TaxID=1962930 RepID=UPI003220A14F
MRWYWIDRFIEFHSGRMARAIKNVSLAEEYLHDHFPGYPVMPNSLVIEGVAQTGGLLVGEYNQFRLKVVLAKVPHAKFYCEAVPGDVLTYTATIEHIHPHGAVVKATSHKGEILQAEMELVFAHLGEDFNNRELFDPGTLTHMMRILRAYEVGKAADGSPLKEPPEETV